MLGGASQIVSMIRVKCNGIYNTTHRARARSGRPRPGGCLRGVRRVGLSRPQRRAHLLLRQAAVAASPHGGNGGARRGVAPARKKATRVEVDHGAVAAAVRVHVVCAARGGRRGERRFTQRGRTVAALRRRRRHRRALQRLLAALLRRRARRAAVVAVPARRRRLRTLKARCIPAIATTHAPLNSRCGRGAPGGSAGGKARGSLDDVRRGSDRRAGACVPRRADARSHAVATVLCRCPLRS